MTVLAGVALTDKILSVLHETLNLDYDLKHGTTHLSTYHRIKECKAEAEAHALIARARKQLEAWRSDCVQMV